MSPPSRPEASIGRAMTKGALAAVVALIVLVLMTPAIVGAAWVLGVAVKAFMLGAGLR